MTLVEINDYGDAPTFRQRWSHLLTLILAGLMLFYGLNLRSGLINAATPYTNVRAGITVNYPLNWLIDEEGDYVFRVRDMSRVGFKTTIQVETRPIGPQTTAQNVLNTLNINRPQTLEAYNPIATSEITLPDESPGTVLDYTFVARDPNPFLESVQVVVLGRDILTIRGSQAIIITFRTDAATFDTDVAIFERFLDSLRFQ
ncbi:MAG: hypothetical protein OHK0046_27620 [Anaerolineae bacterium]